MTRDWSAVSKFPSFDLPSQLRGNQSQYVTRPSFELPRLTVSGWNIGLLCALPCLPSRTCVPRFRALFEYASKLIGRTMRTRASRHCCQLPPGKFLYSSLRAETFRKLYWKLRTPLLFSLSLLSLSPSFQLPSYSSSGGSMLEVSNEIRIPAKATIASFTQAILRGKETSFTPGPFKYYTMWRLCN